MNQLWLEGLPYTVLSIIILLLAFLNYHLGWLVNIVVTVWSIGFLLSKIDQYKKTHSFYYANLFEIGFGCLLSAILAWFAILSL